MSIWDAKTEFYCGCCGVRLYESDRVYAVKSEFYCEECAADMLFMPLYEYLPERDFDSERKERMTDELIGA